MYKLDALRGNTVSWKERMMVCGCSMAGTKACETCLNSPARNIGWEVPSLYEPIETQEAMMRRIIKEELERKEWWNWRKTTNLWYVNSQALGQWCHSQMMVRFTKGLQPLRGYMGRDTVESLCWKGRLNFRCRWFTARYMQWVLIGIYVLFCYLLFRMLKWQSGQAQATTTIMLGWKFITNAKHWPKRTKRTTDAGQPRLLGWPVGD